MSEKLSGWETFILWALLAVREWRTRCLISRRRGALKRGAPRDDNEEMEYLKWSAQANLAGTVVLCVVLASLVYFGLPEAQVLRGVDGMVQAAVLFATPFVGAWMLGVPLWLGLNAAQFIRNPAGSAPSLTAMVFRAARLIVGVCLATSIWWLTTFVLDPILANAKETSMEGAIMSLRDLLKRDFGYDLKISGGVGQSRSDSIVVSASDPADAAVTEMLVLRGIGKGRGILWRSLARTPLKHEGMSLEQVKVETKAVSDAEIITQRENYYFDVGAATLDGGFLPTAIGYRHARTGLVLPYEIGWLHFDSVTDNEPVAPGLGQSIAYGAPGIKATVYVYDRRGDILKDVGATDVKDEFSAAISDLMRLNANARALGDATENGVMIHQKFVIGEDYSVVALAVRGGKFVKLRITFVQDPLLVELVDQSLAAFQDVVARQGDQGGP